MTGTQIERANSEIAQSGQDFLWGDPPLGIYSLPLLLAQRERRLTVSGRTMRIEANVTGRDYTEALLKGRFELGHIGTPPFLNAIAGGAPYRVIAQGAYRVPPFFLVVSPEISDVETLRGRRIALNDLQTCPHSILLRLLNLHNMNASQIEIATFVTAGAIVDAALAGEVFWGRSLGSLSYL